MIYLLLFFEFFKIGLFAIGGGLSTLPFLYDLAERYDWFTAADITFIIAISESTPGPIAVNMATFAGYKAAGTLGGAVATLGLIVPAIIIVCLVAKAMEQYRYHHYVQAGLRSVRPAVVALVSVALFTIVRISLLNWPEFIQSMDWAVLINPKAVILFGVALAAMLKFKKHPIIYIAAGAVVGIFIAP